jgi:hypothetical protein
MIDPLTLTALIVNPSLFRETRSPAAALLALDARANTTRLSLCPPSAFSVPSDDREYTAAREVEDIPTPNPNSYPDPASFSLPRVQKNITTFGVQDDPVTEKFPVLVGQVNLP